MDTEHPIKLQKPKQQKRASETIGKIKTTRQRLRCLYSYSSAQNRGVEKKNTTNMIGPKTLKAFTFLFKWAMAMKNVPFVWDEENRKIVLIHNRRQYLYYILNLLALTMFTRGTEMLGIIYGTATNATISRGIVLFYCFYGLTVPLTITCHINTFIYRKQLESYYNNFFRMNSAIEKAFPHPGLKGSSFERLSPFISRLPFLAAFGILPAFLLIPKRFQFAEITLYSRYGTLNQFWTITAFAWSSLAIMNDYSHAILVAFTLQSYSVTENHWFNAMRKYIRGGGRGTNFGQSLNFRIKKLSTKNDLEKVFEMRNSMTKHASQYREIQLLHNLYRDIFCNTLIPITTFLATVLATLGLFTLIKFSGIFPIVVQAAILAVIIVAISHLVLLSTFSALLTESSKEYLTVLCIHFGYAKYCSSWLRSAATIVVGLGNYFPFVSNSPIVLMSVIADSLVNLLVAVH